MRECQRRQNRCLRENWIFILHAIRITLGEGKRKREKRGKGPARQDRWLNPTKVRAGKSGQLLQVSWAKTEQFIFLVFQIAAETGTYLYRRFLFHNTCCSIWELEIKS